MVPGATTGDGLRPERLIAGRRKQPNNLIKQCLDQMIEGQQDDLHRLASSAHDQVLKRPTEFGMRLALFKGVSNLPVAITGPREENLLGEDPNGKSSFES